MSEEVEFVTSCEVCESECSIVVLNVDEKPVHCPMCGEEAVVKRA